MTLEELGRRAVACKRWRWMPGMLILGHGGHRAVIKGIAWPIEATNGMNARPIAADELPDLSTPATLGCLLALVREAYADPAFCIQCVAGYWYEDSDKRELVPRSNETEAEALVAALEAAP